MRYKLSELPTSQTDISRNRQIKTANIQVTISIKQTVHPKYRTYCYVVSLQELAW